jgi:PilZ domain
MAGPLNEERRASPRISPVTMAGIDRARLRPGRCAYVVDLSSGGALIEADWRLLPGIRVELQVGEPVPLFRVTGRILRCHVALLERERIRYRGAVKFEWQVSFGEVSTHGVAAGTDCPEAQHQRQDEKQIPGQIG